MKIEMKETHVRTCTVALDRWRLQQIVSEFVAEEAGVRLDAPGVSSKITFEDETEGSPPYRVGTRARVTITQDMLPQSADAKSAL